MYMTYSDLCTVICYRFQGFSHQYDGNIMTMHVAIQSLLSLYVKISEKHT